MSSQFADIVDELDAEVFSGDSLEDPANREVLEEHLMRWLRALQGRDDFTVADGFIVVEGEGNDQTFGFASSLDGLVNEHINDRIVECQTDGIEVPIMHIVPFVLIKGQ